MCEHVRQIEIWFSWHNVISSVVELFTAWSMAASWSRSVSINRNMAVKRFNTLSAAYRSASVSMATRSTLVPAPPPPTSPYSSCITATNIEVQLDGLLCGQRYANTHTHFCINLWDGNNIFYTHLRILMPLCSVSIAAQWSIYLGMNTVCCEVHKLKWHR